MTTLPTTKHSKAELDIINWHSLEEKQENLQQTITKDHQDLQNLTANVSKHNRSEMGPFAQISWNKESQQSFVKQTITKDNLELPNLTAKVSLISSEPPSILSSITEKISNAQIFDPLSIQQLYGIDDKTQGKLTVKQAGKQINDIYHASTCDSFASLGVLKEELLQSCAEQNFVHPSKIQAVAIPLCLTLKNGSYPNLIGQAHHGSGKTATFALIMLSRIDTKIPLLQTLCIVHSRELAIQNYDVCVKLGSGMVGLNCTLAIPGRYPPEPWNSQLCVGTPGSLLDKWINSQKRHPMNAFLQYFKVLVVDEADEFLSKQNCSRRRGRGRGRGRGNDRFSGGLYDHLTRIIQEIRCNIHESYQTLLFSATFPRTIYALALKLAPDAIEISLAKKDVALNNILVLTMPCSNHMEKFENLKMIIALANIGQMIVFTNTIKIAQYIVQAMHAKEVEIPCSVLYGSGMQPHLRDATMSNFRNGETVCLVASNVIARGIDVPAVGLVVNFEIPFDAETFMHRVGRCGRFGTRGVCLNFVLAPTQMTHDQRYGYNNKQNYNNMQVNEERRKFDEIAKDYNVHVRHFKQNELELVSKVIQEWLEPFRKH